MSTVTLNFHGVGPISRGMDPGERNCWLDLGFFEAVLDRVKGHPHVRLTVDDGNHSDYEYILPALLARGLRATFFVCSGRLNQASFLSAAQVRDLNAHGMEVGSHGVAHVPWRHLPPQHLYDEVQGSRNALEDVCGRAVESAACPFGSYDRTVLRSLHKARYRFVFTSDGGIASPGKWIQPRITITRMMPMDLISQLIETGPEPMAQFSISLHKLIKKFR